MRSLAVLVPLAILFSSPHLIGGVIFDMDFSNPGEGATHTGSGSFAAGSATGTNWVLTWPNVSTDSTLNEFVTVGGLMRVQDWGGSGTVTSSSISIMSAGMVDIRSVATTIGSDVFNVAAEGVTWFYSLNGGSQISTLITEASLGGPVAAGTSVGTTFSNIPVLPGDTLEIGFTVFVDGAGDGLEISQYDVDFTASVPEPHSFAVCGMIAVCLAARKRRAASMVEGNESVKVA